MSFDEYPNGHVSLVGFAITALMGLASLPEWASGQNDAARPHAEGSPAQPGAAAPATAAGASFYVAVGGRPENDGSLAKPWPTVEFALSKVGAGNTVVVRPGIYRGPWQIRNHPAKPGGPPTLITSEGVQ